MNKQIDDMARDLCECYVERSGGYYSVHPYFDADATAEKMTAKGYRKSTDVAMGIDDIRRYIILNENIAKKCKEENGEQNEEYFKGKLAAFLQIRGFIEVELKKKYESEGADDEKVQ